MEKHQSNSLSEFKENYTRRSLLQIGLATIGLAMTSTGLAQLCEQLATPRQTRGPFFPYDDVVSFPIREIDDPNLPYIEASDSDLTIVKGRNGVAKGQIIQFHGQILKMGQGCEGGKRGVPTLVKRYRSSLASQCIRSLQS